MIIYTTGDLLKSSAEALVNTVNCEGYMGKGIAYQFKLQYPENNKEYIKACKSGNLRIGKIHYYKERDKIIINFPTKNKWRAKSKISYIDEGLDELKKLIENLNINTIAIPPLGSGNGGLIWSEVKKLIEQKLSLLPDNIKIYVYQPSINYSSQPSIEPRLNISALVLMEIKKRLNQFDTLRLQKTAYFMNLFLLQKYFNFKKHKYGPYDNSINIISRSIREFQEYHKVNNTNEAYRILYNKIISDNVENKLNELLPFIIKACDYVNGINSNHELECLSTILFLIEEHKVLSEDQIIKYFKEWSAHKANKFTVDDILEGIKKLNNSRIIEKNLVGYIIVN